MPLPNVSAKILSKVIEYCKYHVDANNAAEGQAPNEDDKKTWDNDFVKVDQSTLFELILVTAGLLEPFGFFSLMLFLDQAANYLNIKELLDLTCLSVANMIKGE